MIGGRVMITDDRGQRVPLFQWTSVDAANPENAELADALMRAGETSQDNRWNKNLSWRDLPMILGGLVVLPVMWLQRWVWPTAPIWTVYIFLPLMMYPLMRLQVRLRQQELSGRYRASLLAYGRCASCGYSLRGVAPDTAGLLPCPECGAAWDSHRVAVLAPTTGAAPPMTDPYRAGLALTNTARPWSLRAMWNRAPSVLDARERAVALVEMGAVAPEWSGLEARGVEELRRRVRRITLPHAWWTVVSAALIAGVLLLASRGLSSVGLFAGGFSNSIIALWMLVMVVMSGPYWVTRVRRAWKGRSQATAQRIAEALVSNDVCPGCARALARDQAGEDGYVTCACGGTWRLALEAPARRRLRAGAAG